ncbi:hypothetical protein RHMOL_Rhmol08G0094100 [Rhododendron molle]|uniref:Uncharacterized protein n=1 Tax=Rhododendron molle TaxID=49168 RepID=A0ACC0MN12_RHOML|nr:hypothetical protein RHMOL_Rhmol08G0094100 [Rhododendron molle]
MTIKRRVAILRNFLPDSVSLQTSYGHESYLHCVHENINIVSTEIYIIAIARVFHFSFLFSFFFLQYNCISLGLTIGAVAAILSDKDLLACFLFSLALNHKQVASYFDKLNSTGLPYYFYLRKLFPSFFQMSAYFAPAFFSYLLGKCLRRQNLLLEVLRLGFVVIGTFSIVWWPYLQSVDAFLQVIIFLLEFC